MTTSSPTALIAACYSKVCAPPPAGRGGSTPRGGRGKGGYTAGQSERIYLLRRRQKALQDLKASRRPSKALQSRVRESSRAVSDRVLEDADYNKRSPRIKRSQKAMAKSWNSPETGGRSDASTVRRSASSMRRQRSFDKKYQQAIGGQ